jgi:Uma2 family endonuclease
MIVMRSVDTRTRAERRYLREPAPLFFPTSEEMPEGQLHFLVCTYLYFLVRDLVEKRAIVTCNSFLYWDPVDPRKRLAPDLAVRMGAYQDPLEIQSWKTWELGAPHLGVEVVSPSDRGRTAWADKLERYRSAGIDEVVRFDPKNFKRPLRLWDRFEGDLVERDLEGENALLCDSLGVYWCVKSDVERGQVLRLARDPLGNELISTPEERQRAAMDREHAATELERQAKDREHQAKERERQAKEQERQAKEQERAAKEAALARVAELEAELRRRDER